MRERGGKYDSSAPLVPLIQGGSVYHCISILKIARYRTFLASSCFSVGSIRHYFPSLGRRSKDRAGARHGNLTPPRISPSCPHCLIPVSPGAVAGQEYHYQIADEGRIRKILTAMRNSPPQAALWTDGHRSAPSLAVFDAVSRTGGLGASSSVASALLSESLSSADVSRYRI